MIIKFKKEDSLYSTGNDEYDACGFESMYYSLGGMFFMKGYIFLETIYDYFGLEWNQDYDNLLFLRKDSSFKSFRIEGDEVIIELE